MKKAKLARKSNLAPEDLSAIRAAVAKAEKNTSGEIALALTTESADYSFHELLAAVIFGAAVFAGLIPVHAAATRIVETAVDDNSNTRICGLPRHGAVFPVCQHSRD